MDRAELLAQWDSAIGSGTFLTDKHDPASLGTPHPTFRTVTVMSSPEIKDFIESGKYKVRLFHNNKKPNSPLYVEIIPEDPMMVPGSGVLPSSPVPTFACDRFVAVSGVQQGWHLFAEQSSTIQKKQSDGDLSFMADYL